VLAKGGAQGPIYNEQQGQEIHKQAVSATQKVVESVDNEG
jgi:hypothetical protein